MRFGHLVARAVAADSVVNGTTNPHSCHAKADYDIPNCDSICKQRIGFTYLDHAARAGVSVALTAYNSREWCFEEHKNWCPATIEGTVNMITRKLLNETLPTLVQDSCGKKCLINTLSNPTRKATYWAGTWAQGMFKNASEPLVVNQTALNVFNESMEHLKKLPVGPALNDTAFADLVCSQRTVASAPDEPPHGPHSGSDDGGDDNQPLAIGLGAGMGVGLTAGASLAAVAATMGFTKGGSGFNAFRDFVENTLGNNPEIFKGPNWARKLLWNDEYYEILDQQLAAERAANAAAEAARPLAEEFEEAFQELAPWEAKFGTRLFHTEVFNSATGAMENAFLAEDLTLGPKSVPASLSRQGYRVFHRVDHTGEPLKTAKGDWAESWHKPSELKPVDNAYWQGVKSQAEAALEGTTQVLRTTKGIVLDSIGQPVVAVDGIQVAIERVGRDAERMALRFTHSMTQLFDKDDPPNAVSKGEGVVGGLLNGAGNLLSMFASHPGGPMDEAELTTEEKWNKGTKGPAIVPAAGGGNSSTTTSTGLGPTSTSSSSTVPSTSTSSASHNSPTVPASTSSPLTSSTSISSSMTNNSTMTSSSMTATPTTNSTMTNSTMTSSSMTSTPMTNSSTFATSTSLAPGWASNWTSSNVMTLTATEYLSTVTLNTTSTPTLTPSVVMMTTTEYLTSVTATRWHSDTPSPTSTPTGTAAALK